jgi:hypothetical protein
MQRWSSRVRVAKKKEKRVKKETEKSKRKKKRDERDKKVKSGGNKEIRERGEGRKEECGRSSVGGDWRRNREKRGERGQTGINSCKYVQTTCSKQ